MLKTICKLAILSAVAVLLLMMDLTPEASPLAFEVQWISDAHAVAGRQRRTRRRGAAVGYSAGKAAGAAEAEAAAASDTASASGQQTTTEQQQAPADQTAEPADGALPLGTIVEELPEGCTTKVIDDVEYYYDGTNHYRAAFQGNELVYVTAKP